jgi:hypothetical protein
MPDVCEGPKRPSTGSEPVTLLSLAAMVLNETALFAQPAFLSTRPLLLCSKDEPADMPWVALRTGYVLS